MTDTELPALGSQRSWILEAAVRRRLDHVLDPTVILPWRLPARVRVLLVADGTLDFGRGDFGLSTFVGSLLNDRRSYVAFDVATAHLRQDVTDAQLMAGAPGVLRSTRGFRFDDPAHFDPDEFDVVWLFGIETNYRQDAYPGRRDLPADRLGDGELLALARHANRGGGLFATGDHGFLGHGLGSAVDRVRGMRHWTPVGGTSEQSMRGVLRNDTNDVGHDFGSRFSDQSDDVPQRIDATPYSARVSLLLEAVYPHPVLCGRGGLIDVFPDHPHEGQCRTPDDLGGTCADGTPEYPPATDGSGPVAPEVIATAHVPAGNTASTGSTASKAATLPHSFPLLSAYDGHRAGVGRVLCDSTWHHFVNVNLIGILEGGTFDDFATPGIDQGKHDGFLSSAAGRAVLARIREYYVNTAVWLATPAAQDRMRARAWWEVVWNDRVVEATVMDPAVRSADLPLLDLHHIGVHARDVLGREAGACQALRWAFPVLDRVWPELRPWIDPWWRWEDELPEPPLPWFAPEPLLAVVLGAGIAALREAHPHPGPEPVGDEETEELLLRGAQVGVERVRERFAQELREVSRLAG